MGRYGVSPFEGVTENANKRLQAGEGVPQGVKGARRAGVRCDCMTTHLQHIKPLEFFELPGLGCFFNAACRKCAIEIKERCG